MGEMGEMGEMEIFHQAVRSHRAKRYPSSEAPPSTIFLVRRVADVALSQEIICCQKGAECYTRQKCHRWIVLDVRPIGGIFSRGRNRPLITTNSTNYSSAALLRRISFLRISLRIDCVRRSGSTLRVISES